MFNEISFFILFELIIIGAMYEFYTLAEKKRFKPQKIFGIIIGAIVFAVNYFFANDIIESKIFLLIIPTVISVFIVELYRKSDYAFVNIGFTILGVIYIAVPFSFANYIVINDGYDFHLLLGFLILIWSFDTLAYIFGVTFGKHRLFERISPKKSWEGFIGGLISNVGMAYLISLVFKDLTFQNWVVLSLIVSVFGTFGDLVESGNILPGHGGVLDRFDAMLLTLPLFYVYLQLVQ